MVVQINKSGKGTKFAKTGGRPAGVIPYKDKYPNRVHITAENYAFLKVFVAKTKETTLVGAVNYILDVVRNTTEVQETLGFEAGSVL